MQVTTVYIKECNLSWLNIMLKFKTVSRRTIESHGKDYPFKFEKLITVVAPVQGHKNV